ncbi:MAG: putative serine/threonine protein kinase [Streblomastix strix]|uniref:Putative serine/threonine protein kinase n=1 Tax=Streblomastix strix TaxID=222440 RepID=A0A5J4W767_9EUKA|nr:MAG: putative serine/threonine protein kinase [Streblomastix strix]
MCTININNNSFSNNIIVFYLSVYEAYDLTYGIVAVKIIKKEIFDARELEAAEIIRRKAKDCPFILDHITQINSESYQILINEYANTMTLAIIAEQSDIQLPTYTLRALMKQIFEGMRAFHETGLIHRDIKCDNILLHSPPGTGRVHAKISDFGFAKKEDGLNEMTYLTGTIPYISPEQLLQNTIITQKVDMYAIGITFYKLITHKYPVNERNINEQIKKIAQLKSIERPSEIKDNILWDLLSQLLEFVPNNRISAAKALQHPYFISPEALSDISKEQLDLASLAAVSEFEGDSSITEFDKDPTFIESQNVSDQNHKLSKILISEKKYQNGQRNFLIAKQRQF